MHNTSEFYIFQNCHSNIISKVKSPIQHTHKSLNGYFNIYFKGTNSSQVVSFMKLYQTILVKFRQRKHESSSMLSLETKCILRTVK